MVISVSRRTDILHYYTPWFFRRLEEGYVLTRNPMNARQISRISLTPETVDCFVFWSKNPAPLLEGLDRLAAYPYYIQFTLNPYGASFEPGLPGLRARVDTFRRLAERAGPDRLVWRYDPVFSAPDWPAERHLAAFAWLSEQLEGCTDTCTISFIDDYRCIRKSLAALDIRDFSDEKKRVLVEEFSQMAGKRGMVLTACAEELEFDGGAVRPGACVDGARIFRLSGRRISGKDRNQRPACSCAPSVDIGAYSCCPAGCVYCYANHSPGLVRRSFEEHRMDSPLLLGVPGVGDVVKERGLL